MPTIPTGPQSGGGAQVIGNAAARNQQREQFLMTQQAQQQAMREQMQMKELEMQFQRTQAEAQRMERSKEFQARLAMDNVKLGAEYGKGVEYVPDKGGGPGEFRVLDTGEESEAGKESREKQERAKRYLDVIHATVPDWVSEHKEEAALLAQADMNEDQFRSELGRISKKVERDTRAEKFAIEDMSAQWPNFLLPPEEGGYDPVEQERVLKTLRNAIRAGATEPELRRHIEELKEEQEKQIAIKYSGDPTNPRLQEVASLYLAKHFNGNLDTARMSIVRDAYRDAIKPDTKEIDDEIEGLDAAFRGPALMGAKNAPAGSRQRKIYDDLVEKRAALVKQKEEKLSNSDQTVRRFRDIMGSVGSAVGAFRLLFGGANQTGAPGQTPIGNAGDEEVTEEQRDTLAAMVDSYQGVSAQKAPEQPKKPGMRPQQQWARIVGKGGAAPPQQAQATPIGKPGEASGAPEEKKPDIEQEKISEGYATYENLKPEDKSAFIERLRKIAKTDSPKAEFAQTLLETILNEGLTPGAGRPGGGEETLEGSEESIVTQEASPGQSSGLGAGLNYTEDQPRDKSPGMGAGLNQTEDQPRPEGASPSPGNTEEPAEKGKISVPGYQGSLRPGEVLLMNLARKSLNAKEKAILQRALNEMQKPKNAEFREKYEALAAERKKSSKG